MSRAISPRHDVDKTLSHPLTAQLADALTRRYKRYAGRLAKCRAHPAVEDVHQLRVSIRRLLAQFALFETLLPEIPARKSRKCLKEQLSALGPLRDTQVQLGYLTRIRHPLPLVAWFRDHLLKLEKRQLRAASKSIRDFESERLRRTVDEARARLAWHGRTLRGQQRFALLARECAEQARREVHRRASDIDPGEAATIHKTRITLKKLRYVLEVLPPDVSGVTTARAARLKLCQRRMGGIQDLEVLERALETFAKSEPEAAVLAEPLERFLQKRKTYAIRRFLKHDAPFLAEALGD
jgi:CHAD domain-containing protein